MCELTERFRGEAKARLSKLHDRATALVNDPKRRPGYVGFMYVGEQTLQATLESTRRVLADERPTYAAMGRVEDNLRAAFHFAL